MIRLLVVARWPLGGIRTYMKYVYRHLDRNRFRITLIAYSTQEDAALVQDARENGIEIILHSTNGRNSPMFMSIMKELGRGQYDLIQSQGFTSGVHGYLANLFHRVPHVLTVHGVLEKKYLEGALAPLKRQVIIRVLGGVSFVYAVSRDMLAHVLEYAPALEKDPERTVVIQNGIPVEKFRPAGERGVFRQRLSVDPRTFLFGFMGRFMEQKGFHLLIDAVEMIEISCSAPDYRILAIGSGDYLHMYKKRIREKGLDHRFIFLPFQRDISSVYRDLDAVLMPSVWEASGLLAMEALCCGASLVASDCIGLREVLDDTPARIFETGSIRDLANAMISEMREPSKEAVRKYVPVAAERYDVRKTASEFETLCIKMIESRNCRRSPVTH